MQYCHADKRQQILIYVRQAKPLYGQATNIPPFFFSLLVSHFAAADSSPIWTNPILPSVVPYRISSPIEKSSPLY